MLWLMRRSWMRNVQAKSIAWLPATTREKAYRSMVRQNVFARRIGLPLMTLMMNLLIGSLILTAVWFASLWLIEHGILSVPDDIRERAAATRG